VFPFNAHNRQLLETALGNEPADLVIKDGILADVYTGRMIPHRSVVVSGKWIAYVGPDADYAIAEKTRVTEAAGRVIAPGFIDPHTHLANYCDISDFLKYAIPGGTTTYITEVESYCFALGAEGFRAFLDQVRTRPVKIFCLIPPMVTTSPAAAPYFITTQEAGNLLNDEVVIGLGEAYWQNAILTPDNRILQLIQETVKRGKSVQGHAAGATDRKLAAYAAAGAVSCHEDTSDGTWKLSSPSGERSICADAPCLLTARTLTSSSAGDISLTWSRRQLTWGWNPWRQSVWRPLTLPSISALIIW
jgi:adenine deaminase